MSNLKNNDPSMFILSSHRIMFPHLDVPHKFKDEDGKEEKEPKYDCTWLIHKSHPDGPALIGAFQQIHAAESLGKFKGMPFEFLGHPDGIWCPLRDGDAYADKMVRRKPEQAALYEPYRGHYFIKATTNIEFPPVVFQQLPKEGRVPVIDIKRDLYAGCFARGVLKIMAFFSNGKYGFSCFINSVLKTGEGEKLGGGGSSADVNDYDLGADATDASQLQAVQIAPAGLPMPGALPGMPSALPSMPGVVPAAQRPALPAMTPPAIPGMLPGMGTPPPAAIPAFTPPPVANMAPPAIPAYTPPPVVPAYVAPAAPEPIYNVWEGQQTVSYDGGVTYQYV